MSVVKISANHLLRIADAVVRKAETTQYLDEDRGYLGGSEISGCARKVVAKHLKVPPTHPRSLMESRRLELGHIVEKWVIDDWMRGLADSKSIVLSHTGENQIELAPKTVNIKLHPDGLISVRSGDGQLQPVAYLEVKSAGSESYDRLAGSLYEEYIGQAIGEMHFGKPDMVLFHIARVDKLTKYHHKVVPYSSEAGEWFEERARWLLAAIEAEELPEGEPSALCAFCPYRGACPQSGQQAWRQSPKVVNEGLVKPTKAMQAKLKKYMKLKEQKADLEAQLLALREDVEGWLNKKKATATAVETNDPEHVIEASFSAPSVRRKINLRKVLEHIPAEMLVECYSEKVIAPSLRISVKKANGKKKAEAISLEAAKDEAAEKPATTSAKAADAESPAELFLLPAGSGK